MTTNVWRYNDIDDTDNDKNDNKDNGKHDNEKAIELQLQLLPLQLSTYYF